MKKLYFVSMTGDGELVLESWFYCERYLQTGFFVNHTYIAPHAIHQSETEGLEMLRRLSVETGAPIRNTLN